MGLILLIVVGGVLGWLASIMMRTDNRHDILTNVAVGIVGALVTGLLSNNGSIIEGLSAVSLLFAVAGSVGTLFLVNYLRSRQLG